MPSCYSKGWTKRPGKTTIRIDSEWNFSMTDNHDPLANISKDAADSAAGAISRLVPWWVPLIIIAIIVAILGFLGWWGYTTVSKYEAEHDAAIARAAAWQKQDAADALEARTRLACSTISAQAQTAFDAAITAQTQALSANVSKHQAISHAIDISPPTDDAPDAPVLARTLDSLYPRTSSASAGTHSASSDGSH